MAHIEHRAGAVKLREARSKATNAPAADFLAVVIAQEPQILVAMKRRRDKLVSSLDAFLARTNA
jgi:hypothetical protein